MRFGRRGKLKKIQKPLCFLFVFLFLSSLSAVFAFGESEEFSAYASEKEAEALRSTVTELPESGNNMSYIAFGAVILAAVIFVFALAVCLLVKKAKKKK